MNEDDPVTQDPPLHTPDDYTQAETMMGLIVVGGIAMIVAYLGFYLPLSTLTLEHGNEIVNTYGRDHGPLGPVVPAVMFGLILVIAKFPRFPFVIAASWTILVIESIGIALILLFLTVWEPVYSLYLASWVSDRPLEFMQAADTVNQIIELYGVEHESIVGLKEALDVGQWASICLLASWGAYWWAFLGAQDNALTVREGFEEG